MDSIKLIGIETLLKIESRKINYSGFNVDSSQKAYIDYQTAKGMSKAAQLGIAADAMAADIRAAFATGQLTEAEAERLMNVLSEIVGDAPLAQAYLDGENILAQGSMAKIDSGRSIGDNNLNVTDGYLHGEGTRKTVDDIIKEGIETTNGKGIARNFEKSGGYLQTVKDFYSLNPTNVKEIQTQYGKGYVGTLSTGITVVARPGSKTGGATLEIRISNNKIYKIRY